MRKLPPRRNDRAVMPKGEDVRPTPDVPGYLITKEGLIFSDTDPPLAMAQRDYIGRKQKRRRVRLSSGGRVRDYYVAALVLEAWVGPRPEGAVAQHYDADPMNCSLENLFWGFPQTRIDPAEFVRVWQSSQSVREVAERLGKEHPTITAVAKRMRDNGVPLRAIERKTQTDDDYQALTELALSLNHEDKK